MVKPCSSTGILWVIKFSIDNNPTQSYGRLAHWSGTEFECFKHKEQCEWDIVLQSCKCNFSKCFKSLSCDIQLRLSVWHAVFLPHWLILVLLLFFYRINCSLAHFFETRNSVALMWMWNSVALMWMMMYDYWLQVFSQMQCLRSEHIPFTIVPGTVPVIETTVIPMPISW